MLGRGQAQVHRKIVFPAEVRIPAVEDAEHWRHKPPLPNLGMMVMELACFDFLTAALQKGHCNTWINYLDT